VPRFWSLLRRGLAEALAEAGATSRDVAGVSYSSQANSFVLLDEADEPLTPIVLWTDVRAHPIAGELSEFSQREEFARRVGFAGWSGGFAVPKWRWFQENEPQRWARCRRALTLSDYLIFALTGEAVGDASTAAFLGLYDLERRRWWLEALEVAGVDAHQLCRPLAPGTLAGSTHSRSTDLLGLPAGIPFAVGGLDHHVAALGSGLGRHAEASISTGTVLAAMTLVPKAVPCRGCYHGPHFDGTRYFRLAFDSEGAGQLEAYQREFGSGYDFVALLQLAATAQPATNAPPEFGVASHGAAVRYLLEKIAATHRDLLRQVSGGANLSPVVATGGGARSPLWLQIKADMLGAPIIAATTAELASLGAAMLASVTAKWHADADEAMEAMLRVGRVFEPTVEGMARYRDWKP
jgi:sugar (pentulose or hexulose) kinase